MYGRALQLDEHLPNALLGLADVLSARVMDGFSDTPEIDLRHAEELVSKALAVDPNSWHAHLTKDNILRAQKHYEKAIAEFETVIALNPNTVNGRSHLARAKIFIGEPADAIPLLEQAMKISPRHPGIGYLHYRLGLANLLLGNVDEAIRWYEKAALTYYEPAHAYLQLGAAFGLKGDKAAAQVALAEAVKRRPDYATIAGVRKHSISNRPKFVELREQTIIDGLRKAGLPE